MNEYRQWLLKQRNEAQFHADNLKMKILNGDMRAFAEYRELDNIAFVYERALIKYDELHEDEQS